MTTIEGVLDTLHGIMATFDPDGRGRPRYERAADPFTFDRQPRTALDAYYLDPPSVRTAAAYYQGANLVAEMTVWIAREARDDADRAIRDLAADLARLRRALVAADLGADTNLHERAITMHAAPRADDAVTVIGRLRFAVDYDADDDYP